MNFLTLALAQTLHRNAWIKRCCGDAHCSARCFYTGGCGLKIWISLNGVRNQRSQFRVVKGTDPVRYHGAAAMRAGPASGNLRPSRLRHDVGAVRRLLERTAGKCEARNSPEKSADVHAHRSLVKLEDEPVHFGGNAHENLAHDVNHFAVLGEDGAPTMRAGGKEQSAVLGLDE